MIRYAARRMEMGLLFYCCDVSFYPRAGSLPHWRISTEWEDEFECKHSVPLAERRVSTFLDTRSALSRTTQTASAALNKHTPGLA
jgi:hypothetical protein